MSTQETDKGRTIADLKTLIASVESEWGNEEPSPQEMSSESTSPGVSSCRRQDLRHAGTGSDEVSSCQRQDRRPDDVGSVPGGSSPESAQPEIITDPEQARTIALHRLSARARSRAELKKDLVARHVEESLANQIVTRFIEVGLVDDESFAREWVASRRGPKSLSTARLKRELKGKGIAPNVIDEALGEADGSEAEVALQLARRRAKALVGKDRATMTRRLAAQLERRGFSQAVVRRAVIQAVDEVIDGTSDDAAD